MQITDQRRIWHSPWPWLALGSATIAATVAMLQPWKAAPESEPAAPVPAAVAKPSPAPAMTTASAAPQVPPPISPQPEPQATQQAIVPAADPIPAVSDMAPPSPPAKAAIVRAEKDIKPAPPPQKTAKDVQAREASRSDEQPIPTWQELPTSIQQEIPRLQANGYIYSPNKADRTVLINQKLMHEGDNIGPDLTLEKLTPSGMVLNYKGYRFRSSY